MIVITTVIHEGFNRNENSIKLLKLRSHPHCLSWMISSHHWFPYPRNLDDQLGLQILSSPRSWAKIQLICCWSGSPSDSPFDHMAPAAARASFLRDSLRFTPATCSPTPACKQGPLLAAYPGRIPTVPKDFKELWIPWLQSAWCIPSSASHRTGTRSYWTGWDSTSTTHSPMLGLDCLTIVVAGAPCRRTFRSSPLLSSSAPIHQDPVALSPLLSFVSLLQLSLGYDLCLSALYDWIIG